MVEKKQARRSRAKNLGERRVTKCEARRAEQKYKREASHKKAKLEELSNNISEKEPVNERSE